MMALPEVGAGMKVVRPSEPASLPKYSNNLAQRGFFAFWEIFNSLEVKIYGKRKNQSTIKKL